MTEASGRVVATERGRDLVLVRSLALSDAEAWAYLTESELTEQWFGPWEGDHRVGGAVRVRMRFEEHEPAVTMKILACEPPRALALLSDEEVGSWRLELHLEPDGEDSLLTFVHHLAPDDAVGEIGPGWEYYLDLLVAATEGTERPGFDQYYPALREAYLAM
ncbi:SRPBCC family protein [Leucobacter chromiiresistens]|uniref:ATPase n=1 Tax=Leucobacter chromiiresistens TaxID=1079994 RepID=A0A147EPY0_9MICO|nr:SRPBCC family protein [Leucobacter chromiiresistens]KTR86438.1 ATPase [Leucobacter chromiiresistens]